MPGSGRPERSGWRAVGVLVVVTLFGFVDRQVFVLLAEPIRLSLGLSDFQLGLLQGGGLALFAAAAGYPLGWLADRFDRRLVLGACLLVWSAAVVACGASRGFTELFVASAFVGAGEAGLVPVVYAMIPELFDDRRRLLANSVYATATRLGVGLAISACALLIGWSEAARPYLPGALRTMQTWRLTFFAAALPAPLMILLVATIPGRGRAAAAGAAAAGATGLTLGAHLLANRRTLAGFFLGMGAAAFGFASIISWVPVITMRMYGVEPAEAGRVTGLVTLAATAVGFAGGLAGLRFFAPRLGPRLPVAALSSASAAAAAASLALLWTAAAMQIFVLQGVQMALVIAALMVVPTALQDLAPPHLRSRVIALYGVVFMICGVLSPVAVGALSDRLGARPDGLLIAAVFSSTAALLTAAGLLAWCAGPYGRTALASAGREPAPA